MDHKFDFRSIIEKLIETNFWSIWIILASFDHFIEGYEPQKPILVQIFVVYSLFDRFRVWQLMH